MKRATTKAGGASSSPTPAAERKPAAPANPPNDLRPRLRFPEFRKAGGWERKRVSSAIDLISGMHLSPEQYDTAGEVPYFTGPSDFTNEIQHVTRWTKRSANVAQPEDTLITVKGSGVGEVWYSTLPAVALGRQLMAVRAKNGSSQFVYQFLLTKKSRFEDLGAGNLIPGLSRTDILEMEAHFPDPAEQHRIASCLSSLDELLAAERQKLDALKAHKQGLLQQLFPRAGETRPRLRFPEFRKAGGWEEMKVGDIFRTTRGQVLPMTQVKDAKTCETPFPVYSSQTKNSGLCGYYAEFLFQDAITWTTDGANAGDVNYRPGKFYCTNVCGVLLNSDGYANQCVAALIGSVSRQHVSYVGNPKLMNGVMSEILIPVPPVPEQHRIASCLSSLDELITAQSDKVEALKTHKKGLMQQLFPSPAEVEA